MESHEHDGHTFHLLGRHHLPAAKLLIGDGGAGLWFSWSTQTHDLVQVLRTPLATEAVLGVPDGRGVVVVGAGAEVTDLRVPLQAHDLVTGELLWRRSDLVVWNLAAGQVGKIWAVQFEGPHGRGVVSMVNGCPINGDFRPTRASRLPKKRALPFPPPEALPQLTFRSARRAAASGLRLKPKGWTEIDESRREHYFGSTPPEGPVPNEEIVRLLKLLRAWEGRSGHDVEEEVEGLGTLLREPSAWLRDRWAIGSDVREPFADARGPDSLMPIGKQADTFLCFTGVFAGSGRVGLFRRGSFDGPIPLTSWLSSEIWALAEKREMTPVERCAEMHKLRSE